MWVVVDGWKEKNWVSFVNKTSTNDLWVNRNEDFDDVRDSELLDFFMIFSLSEKSWCIWQINRLFLMHSSHLNIIMKFYRKRRKKTEVQDICKTRKKKTEFRGTRRNEVNKQQHQQTRRKRNRSIPQTILLSYIQMYVSFLALVNFAMNKRWRGIYHFTMVKRKINK